MTAAGILHQNLALQSFQFWVFTCEGIRQQIKLTEVKILANIGNQAHDRQVCRPSSFHLKFYCRKYPMERIRVHIGIRFHCMNNADIVKHNCCQALIVVDQVLNLIK